MFTTRMENKIKAIEEQIKAAERGLAESETVEVETLDSSIEAVLVSMLTEQEGVGDA